MRKLALVLAAAAAALIPAGSAEAATPRAKRCIPKGTKTVVKNKYARVFTADGPGPSADPDVQRRLYGCMYSTGRRALLSVAWDDDYVTAGSFSNVRLNGRFAAWEHEAYDISCKADCPPDYNPTTWSVNVVDLRRPNKERGTFAGGDVTDLVVTRTGAIAWIEPGKVKAIDADGERVLASKNEIAIESLELVGREVSWLEGTERASAVLR
jgi:hypothetical protein